jgi:hypothetical protein
VDPELEVAKSPGGKLIRLGVVLIELRVEGAKLEVMVGKLPSAN